MRSPLPNGGKTSDWRKRSYNRPKTAVGYSATLPKKNPSSPNVDVRDGKLAAARVQSDSHIDTPASVERAGPILRWAGSKYRILPSLLSCAPANFGRYFEPFAGSASLFLALAPTSAVLGDINPHLIGAYRTVRARPSAVYREFRAIPGSKRAYYQIRAVDPNNLSAIQRAARFLYLNQFCFNGVYRENLRGQFNVPRGTKFRTLPTEDTYMEFARRLRTTELRCADFEDSLRDVRKGDFVYLDPPYAKHRARNRGEYGRDAFGTDDIDRLVGMMKALDQIGAKVMTSFFNSTRLRGAFRNWSIRTIGVARSVSGFVSERGHVRELIICNY